MEKRKGLIKRVTIKDIAERTGLAVSTVSMAINNHPKIKESTKKLVKDIAEKLHYTPNVSARALSKRRTNLMGVLIPSVMDSFYPELIQGIEDVLFETEINPIICHTRDNPEKEKIYFRRLLDKQVDGIIFEPPVGNQISDQLMEAKAKDVPMVAILRSMPGIDVPYVVVDNKQGAYMATKHLLELGHRNIGHLAAPAKLPISSARIAGYREALEEYGVEYNPNWVVESNFNWEAGMWSMRNLLSRSDNITAVFVASDIMAVGASYAIRNFGFKIPLDMSIVGFDGLYISEVAEVPLTTVSQPRYDIGVRAANKLLAMLNKNIEGSETLEPNLLIRASTSPPRTR